MSLTLVVATKQKPWPTWSVAVLLQVAGCHDFHTSLWEDCQEVPAAKAMALADPHADPGFAFSRNHGYRIHNRVLIEGLL